MEAFMKLARAGLVLVFANTLAGCGSPSSSPLSEWQAALSGPSGSSGSSLLSSGVLWVDSQSNRAAVWWPNGTAVGGDVLLGDGPAGSQLVGGGDFDGDGQGDALWWDPTGGNVTIWGMSGTTVVSNNFVGNGSPPWKIVGQGDFDGDGKTDILWELPDGTLSIWFMSSTSSVRSFGYAGSAPGVLSAIGDFNGDGRDDIVWRVGGTDVRIWLMNGTSVAASVSTGSATADWVIKGTGQFDGDGVPDILWYNVTTGQVSIWLMYSSGFVRTWTVPAQVYLDWTLIGPVTLQRSDGTREPLSGLMWRNANGAMAFWRMQDASTVLEYGPALPAGKNWTLAGTTPLMGLAPVPPALPAPVAPDPLPSKTPRIFIAPCSFADRQGVKIDPVRDWFANAVLPTLRTISYGAMQPGLSVGGHFYPLGNYLPAQAWAASVPRSAEVQNCVNQAAAEYDLSVDDVLVAFWNYDGGQNGDPPYDPAGDAGKYVALGPDGLNGAAIQEIIHALGIPPHSQNEAGVEYGDPWDVMSCNNCFSYDLNAFFRTRLVGIPANRFQVLEPGTTQLILAATERPDAPGMLAARADITEIEGVYQYYLEFHAKGGILNGSIPQDTVLINKVVGSNPRLMGTNAGTGEWLPGQTFTSTLKNLQATVQTIAPVSGWASVEVTIH
jgi:hypothetical protein